MSWRDTLSDAQVRLEKLEAAEEAILLGAKVASVETDGRKVEYRNYQSDLNALQTAIQETRIVIRRLSGAGGGGAMIPVFR